MSGIFKGIKKVFKKIVKVVKKIAPVILAIGAIVFTGGAALGLTAMAGGWSAAAAGVSSALGASGVVGSVLTGAITQAGYGALAGGAIAAATGGDIGDGMKQGALTGAVTGGVTGGFNAMRAGPGVTGGEAVQAGGAKTFPLDVQRSTGGTLIDEAGNVIADTAGRGGLLSRAFQPGGWIERNQDLVGKTVSGVGQGLMAGAEADAEKDLMREHYRQRSANYGEADPGQRYRGLTPGNSGMSPTERFSPGYYGQFEYRYDPQQGRVVRVPLENGQ